VFCFWHCRRGDIVEASSEAGTALLFVNSLLFGVIMLGGLTVNFFYCGYMLIKKEYFRHNTFWSSYATGNVMLCILAGFTWYSQFLFYGMGSTQMGKYDFASWSLHMSFIIILSNVWGILLREWIGVSKRIYWVLISGLLVLILSTFIIGTAQLLAA
jgi:L-rhamnose-H+ transport protein